jgi:hypothetical protein
MATPRVGCPQLAIMQTVPTLILMHFFNSFPAGHAPIAISQLLKPPELPVLEGVTVPDALSVQPVITFALAGLDGSVNTTMRICELFRGFDDVLV